MLHAHAITGVPVCMQHAHVYDSAFERPPPAAILKCTDHAHAATSRASVTGVPEALGHAMREQSEVSLLLTATASVIRSGVSRRKGRAERTGQRAP
eukprot:scaffold48406_cov32-Tisochrysis_lutea.AAC.3